MRRTTSLAIASLALSGACYHATIETGMASNGQVIEKEWASSFIDGLVPPDVVETAAKCPNGVAKVETEHSFLNSLVAGLTFGIYTPIHIKVTCGTGRRAELPTVKANGDLAAAMTKAAELSVETDAPVLVDTK
jgi:Bor protein.